MEMDNKYNVHEWVNYLKEKPLAWIFLGIAIMYVFFSIAQSLIVFIGGSALGLYLYNIYDHGNNKPVHIVKSSWATIRNIGDMFIGDVNDVNKEKYENYKKNRFNPSRWTVGDMVWNSSRNNRPKTP